MRLVPRSLTGRLVLVLIVGLLAAQLLGLAIVLQDRGAALYQASGLQTAQNVGALVDLLDTLAPPERERVAGALSTNVLPAHPIRPTAPAASARGTGCATHGDGARLSAPRPRRSAGSGRRHRRSGAIRAFAATEHPFAWRMHRFAPLRGASFMVQVQLRDGTWAGFERRLPQELSRFRSDC